MGPRWPAAPQLSCFHSDCPHLLPVSSCSSTSSGASRAHSRASPGHTLTHEHCQLRQALCPSAAPSILDSYTLLAQAQQHRWQVTQCQLRIDHLLPTTLGLVTTHSQKKTLPALLHWANLSKWIHLDLMKIESSLDALSS